MARPDFYLKAGDTDSVMSAVLRDANYEAVDIQGATVEFILRALAGGPALIHRSASVEQSGDGTDGSMGAVEFVWQTGETNTSGLFLGEWRVTFADSSVQTYPNVGYILVLISEALA